MGAGVVLEKSPIGVNPPWRGSGSSQERDHAHHEDRADVEGDELFDEGGVLVPAEGKLRRCVVAEVERQLGPKVGAVAALVYDAGAFVNADSGAVIATRVRFVIAGVLKQASELGCELKGSGRAAADRARPRAATGTKSRPPTARAD